MRCPAVLQMYEEGKYVEVIHVESVIKNRENLISPCFLFLILYRFHWGSNPYVILSAEA